MIYKIDIPMAPVAQARPRAVNVANRRKYYRPNKPKIILHDPIKVKRYKQLLAYYVRQHYTDEPLTGPLRVTVRFYRDIQKSDSKKKQKAKDNGEIRPTKKPDVDNYIKSTFDALNGVLWADDNEIVEFATSKWYSKHPHIELQVETLDVKGD